MVDSDGAAAAERDGASPRAGRRLLVAVCPAAFVTLISVNALSPFLAIVAEDLGTTVSLLGQVPALTMALATALGLVVGPLADHYGHRRLLLIGTLAIVGGGTVVAAAPFAPLLFLAALTGAATRAIIAPVSFAIVSASLTGPASRLAISRVIVATSAGSLAGPPLLTTIGAHLGWRAAFVAVALLGALATLLAGRLLPPDRPRPDQRLDLRETLRAYGVIFGHRPILGVYLSSMLRNTLSWMVSIYLGAYLVQRHALPLQEVGLAFTVSGLGLLAGGYIFGGRIGGLPPRTTLAASYSAMGVLLAGFLLLPVDVRLALCFLGLSSTLGGGCAVLEPALIAGEAPAGRGTTLTSHFAFQSLGSALAGSIGGLLIALGGFTAIGSVVPILGLSAAAAVLLLGRRAAAVAPRASPRERAG